MPRYFMGLMVPPGIRDQLHAFAQFIEDTLPEHDSYKTSWNSPADLHCTLLFIGQYPDEDYLVQQMEQLARTLSPLTLTITGQTHWLGRNSLALAVTGAESVGTAFVDQLGHLSSDAWAGRRPFYGHVTRGRVRPIPSPDADPFASHTVDRLTWQADHVQLVRSRDASSGPRYEVVAQTPLLGDSSR